MNIGFIGLGKLGLPCALAINNKGHRVLGYDVNYGIKEYLKNRKIPYREELADQLLLSHDIEWAEPEQLVSESDIIFIAIQTPHSPKYEGIDRLPSERVDFDYTWLVECVTDINKIIERQNKEKTIVIISTVLPGTIRREIKPLLNDLVKLCYNPFFIAMGTTIRDFLNPEFVLFGVEDPNSFEICSLFYKTLHDRPIYRCTLEEAELIKVSYNTFITMKICLANTIMEMSHKLNNINCDNVMNALVLSNERLISAKYLAGGMGDGGGCHPRDNIALSWLAQKVNLSYDWYENLMLCREKQTDWLADIIQEHKQDLPVIILGKTFKKDTNLINGSPSLLLYKILQERGIEAEMFDPWIDHGEVPIQKTALFFIATNHSEFNNYHFKEGSIVIDPWRFITENEGIKLIQVGVSKENKD